MGEYKDRDRYWIFSIFLTLIFFLSSINFIFADNHLSKIENLNSENYSTTIYFSTDPKVGYLDLEIEFVERLSSCCFGFGNNLDLYVLSYEILGSFNIGFLCDKSYCKYIIKIKSLQNDCIYNRLHIQHIIFYFT